MCVVFFVYDAMDTLLRYTDLGMFCAVAMKKTLVSRVPDCFVEDSTQ